MRDRKAFLGSEIPWILVLMIALFIFSFFFVKGNELVSDAISSPDGNVDWEAGFLAVSAANMPVQHNGQTYTLAELLTQVPRPEHGETPGEVLSIIQQAELPDTPLITAAVIAEDGWGICARQGWNTDCDLLDDISGVDTMEEKIRVAREAYGDRGAIGTVALPSDPQVTIMVRVLR